MVWKEVSNNEFYKKIANQDVTVSIEGNYPYKAIFNARRGNWPVGFVQNGGTNEPDNYYIVAEDKI